MTLGYRLRSSGLILTLGFAWSIVAIHQESDAHSTTISFDTAWDLVLKNNPDLRAGELAVEAADGRAKQAGAWPNPEFSLEGENLSGTGEVSALNAAQTTYSIAQQIETGGKRRQRRAIAQSERDIASVELEARRIDIWLDFVHAFVETLAAQEKLKLAEENARLFEEVRKAVSERVVAGRVPPLEATRAEVELSLSTVELEKARRKLEAARSQLASLWAETEPTFTLVAGKVENVPAIPDVADRASSLMRNRDLARLEKDVTLKRATLERERVAAIPDLVIAGGIRRSEDTGEQTYVAEIALPIPIFNRNRGNIRAAEKELARIQQEREAARLRLSAQLEGLLSGGAAEYEEIRTLRDKAIPGAQEAFETAKNGYRQGKFTYLELLDAERALVEIRWRFLETLAGYHKTLADIGRVIGDPERWSFF